MGITFLPEAIAVVLFDTGSPLFQNVVYMQPAMTLNFWLSCLCILVAGIIGMFYYAGLYSAGVGTQGFVYFR